MVRTLLLALLFFSFSVARSQVLFTYGKDSVTVAEFLKAYQKNNTAGNKESYSLNSYLDLYISSKLKVKEAKMLGYDTLPQMVADLANLREQIIPTYLNDEQGMKRLLDEAFTRSQKDIHLAHVFIAFNPNGIYDSLAAEKKAAAAYARLTKGEDFGKVAMEFSDDPAVKTNRGDIGYITAFTLPYELENLAYNTAAGKLSAMHRSKAGIHIFKNLGERTDPGTMKAAVILFAFPPDAGNETKAGIKKLADSIYNRLQKGDDFGKLAEKFSNDVVSAASQGMIAEFGTGQYDPAFESIAFSLAKDGAISKPFMNAHGWVIVKRVGRKPVSTNKNDPAAVDALTEKLQTSDRINTLRASLAKKLMTTLGFRSYDASRSVLGPFTDSALNNINPSTPGSINATTPLFAIGDRTISALNWIEYARTFRYKSDGTGIKPLNQLWNEFVENSVINYYKDNLEKFNPEFKAQLQEFRDGNLFFEIMQRKIWGPVQADTAALEKYYEANRAKYKWNKSADAVIFYSTDKKTTAAFLKELQKDPAKWRQTIVPFEEKIAADSNRFELDQIPGGKGNIKNGSVTKPEVNISDNTEFFAWIVKLYPQQEQRSFADAKGLVIADYQNELETKWLNELRAKYPVTINQPVLLELLKKN